MLFHVLLGAGAAEEDDDDDVPDLVENFDEASKGEEKVKSEGKPVHFFITLKGRHQSVVALLVPAPKPGHLSFSDRNFK